MPEKTVQLNEGVTKGQMKESARGGAICTQPALQTLEKPSSLL